jgi:hypothetical protein
MLPFVDMHCQLLAGRTTGRAPEDALAMCAERPLMADYGEIMEGTGWEGLTRVRRRLQVIGGGLAKAEEFPTSQGIGPRHRVHV